MNAFVVLLATTCAPGADPVIRVQSAAPAVPSYSYADSGLEGQPQESRPRFFARIRNLFGRRNQNAEQIPADSYPIYQNGAQAPGSFRTGVLSTTPTSGVPVISSGPIGSAVVAPGGVSSPLPLAQPQRMPSSDTPLR